MSDSATIGVCVMSLFIIPYRLWPLVLMIVVWYVVKNQSPLQWNNMMYSKTSSDQVDLWKKLEPLLLERPVTMAHMLYGQLKQRRKLRYIKRDKRFYDIIQNLWKFRMYNTDAIVNIVLLLEHFLKIHFNVVLQIYDTSLYVPVMLDIRDDIMALLDDIDFCIPEVSRIHQIDDIPRYLYDIKKSLAFVLSQYLKVVKNKFLKTHSHLFTFTCL